MCYINVSIISYMYPNSVINSIYDVICVISCIGIIDVLIDIVTSVNLNSTVIL